MSHAVPVKWVLLLRCRTICELMKAKKTVTQRALWRSN